MSVSHVDWDLLAEHLGGALAGTPEGERVARLVATDPTWAGAAAHLTEALGAVAADLRSVPPAPAMPDDVAARLDAALRTAAVPAVPADSGAAGRTAVAAVPTTRPPVPPPYPERPPGHPGDPGGHAATGPGRRDRRRRRAAWGAALAVTAGVATFAAIGLGPLGLVQFAGEDSGAGDAAGAPEVAVEEVPPLSADGGGGPLMIASGTDYGPDTSQFLTNLAPAAPRVEGEAEDDSLGGFDARDRISSAPEPPLDRVWNDPQPCLAAVEAAQPEPAYAHQIDFATFQGDPAVVIWLIAEDGSEWVWVAGPDCGTATAGPDERYQTRLR